MKLFFKLIAIIVFFLTLFSKTHAQSAQNDWQFIEKQKFHKHEFDKRKVNFMFVGKNPIVRYNPVSLTFGGLMYFYQRAISPQFSSKCGYEISCSNFSRKCIQEYGLLKGIALTADRLTRCTPFAAIDLNPIYLNKEMKMIDNPKQYRLHP